MNRLAVITPAHTPYHGDLMERSAKRVGIEVLRYKEGEPWPNDFRVAKMEHALEFIKTLPDRYTHVMLVDSSDSLFLAGEDEILQNFGKVWRVLLSGEKNCYPHPGLRHVYDTEFRERTDWHFVNSGGWIADRTSAERSLDIARQMGTFCDQYCWTLAHLTAARGTHDSRGRLYEFWTLAFESLTYTNGMVRTVSNPDPDWPRQLPPIQIDQDCGVFQSMYLHQRDELAMRGDRLHNLLTGEQPCVLHWNGTKNAGVPYSRAGIWYTRDVWKKFNGAVSVSDDLAKRLSEESVVA